MTIHEIAHNLSQLNRWLRASTQPRRPYSVAQHCVVGARMLKPHLARAFLFHESAEAHFGFDVDPRLKKQMWVTDPVEGVVRLDKGEKLYLEREAPKHNVPLHSLYSVEVSVLDKDLARAEAHWLLRERGAGLPWTKEYALRAEASEAVAQSLKERGGWQYWRDQFIALWRKVS